MNDSKPKVVSLADHRRTRLPLVGFSEHFDKPVNAAWFDAWVESDGSIVMRIDKARLTYEGRGLSYGADDEPRFRARGDAYEMRIAPVDVSSFVRDMQRVGNTSRRRVERQRGDHLWRCVPNGDGTFTVTHDQQTAVFEPFSPRLRKGHVPDGPRGPGGIQLVKSAMVAPKCDACRRVVQVGETMYRERRVKEIYFGREHTKYRTFGDTELCSTCIANAPNKGIGEVG